MIRANIIEAFEKFSIWLYFLDQEMRDFVSIIIKGVLNKAGINFNHRHT